MKLASQNANAMMIGLSVRAAGNGSMSVFAKNNNCFECGALKNLHNHHVVPRSLGGRKTITLCAHCHGLIHDKDLTKISALTKKSMKKMKAEGKYTGGKVPYGFNLVGGKLITNNSEQQVIKQVREHREAGMSLRQIARCLTEEGIKSRAGKPFHFQTVARIVATNEI